MTEESRLRRKRLDHERYMRNREERKMKQREYYQLNRKRILSQKRACGLLEFGTNRQSISCPTT